MASEHGITREFTSVELRRLGLPKECKDGTVIEDRLLETCDEGETTSEMRFVIFEHDGGTWGCPYTKREDGSCTFERKVVATRYIEKTVLVQATEIDEAA